MDEEFLLFARRKESLPSQVNRDTMECAKSTENNYTKDSRGSFESLGLDSWLIEVLKSLSIFKPTEVQASCIPAILKGKNIIAAAKTGSGKTATFALPILHELARDPHGLYLLIVTPTRELAIQIAEQLQVLGKAMRLTMCVAVGGLDMMKQATDLSRKPHVIVATPGRLVDLLSSCEIDMRRLKYLVFDEADRLLASDSSFIKSEIPIIIERVGNFATKWLFFSATMTNAVSNFFTTSRPSIEPFVFNGNTEYGTVATLDQYIMLIPSQVRDAHLVQLLRDALSHKTLMIFVGKCKTCELLLRTLKQLKIYAVALHGKMSQRARLASLLKFKSGSVSCLITTDVGSRGLDIPAVEVVINFDLPADAHDYVHRVGRVARAGRPGVAISFVYELDMDLLANIESCIQRKIAPFEQAPKESDVLKILNEVSVAKRAASISLHDQKFGQKADNNKRKWSTNK